MKKNLLFLAGLFSLALFSQSTDLDRFHFKTKNVRLAQKYTEPEKKTYSVAVLENRTGVDLDTDKVYINSFTKDEANPTYKIDLKLNNTIVYGDPEIVQRQEVNKDKSGKITSTRNFYKVKQKIEAKGICYINGVAYSYPSHSENPVTSEYSSSALARENYLLQRSTWADNFKNNFQQEVYNQTNSYINKDYGFSLRDTNVRLWLLGSKKHPEYENQQQALKIIQDAFAKVDYTKISESLASDLAPAIKIFEDEIKNNAEDNRKNKKIRYSAYYNLMKIYYHMEDYANAEKYANLLVENDYDKKDGKELIEDIQNVKRLQALNKVNSYHFDFPNEKRHTISINEY